MFTDQFRWFKVLVTLTILITLIWWGVLQAVAGDTTYIEITESLDSFVGQTVCFGGEIISFSQEEMEIVLTDRSMEVRLDVSDFPELFELKIDSPVSGQGIVQSNGRILVTDYHYHRLRWVKVWLSLIVTPLILGYFFWRFRFNWQKLVFEERRKKVL